MYVCMCVLGVVVMIARFQWVGIAAPASIPLPASQSSSTTVAVSGDSEAVPSPRMNYFIKVVFCPISLSVSRCRICIGQDTLRSTSNEIRVSVVTPTCSRDSVTAVSLAVEFGWIFHQCYGCPICLSRCLGSNRLIKMFV